MAAKIRTNDEVIVITGKDKGKTGKVTSVLTSEHKVLVEGINVKKNTRNLTQILAFRAVL